MIQRMIITLSLHSKKAKKLKPRENENIIYLNDERYMKDEALTSVDKRRGLHCFVFVLLTILRKETNAQF